MFGIGKRSINSSMTNIYLFLFILIINQFLTIHSFRLMSNDLEQVLTSTISKYLIISALTDFLKEKKRDIDLAFDVDN